MVALQLFWPKVSQVLGLDQGWLALGRCHVWEAPLALGRCHVLEALQHFLLRQPTRFYFFALHLQRSPSQRLPPPVQLQLRRLQQEKFALLAQEEKPQVVHIRLLEKPLVVAALVEAEYAGVRFYGHGALCAGSLPPKCQPGSPLKILRATGPRAVVCRAHASSRHQ